MPKLRDTAVAGGWTDRDEAGQVFVFGSQAVDDPGAHRRAKQVRGAAMKEERRGSMGDAFGVHAVQEAEIIDVAGHVRKQLGDPAAGFAVLGEFPGRLHDSLRRIAFAGVGSLAGVVKRHLLAIVRGEPRLVVERIDLADAALHEQKDDALGTGSEVRRLVCYGRVCNRAAGGKG